MAEDLRKLAANPPKDPQDRRALMEAARSLYLALETPSDALPRLFFAPMQLPLAHIGVEMGLFQKLADEPDREWSTEDLASATGAEEALVNRIARYLASFGLLGQTSNGGYQATEISKWLATPGGRGGVTHYHRTIAPAVQALPEVLKEQGYRNPTDSSNTGFQKAHNISVPAHSWVPEDPSLLEAFHASMKANPPGVTKWVDAFPIESLRLSEDEIKSGRALLVDVGGGSGHEGVVLRERHNLPGKMILEDQERVISKIDKTGLEAHGIEAMSHDFFQPQPVKGAKAYYMRNIMHDWSDDKCVEILNQLREVLSSDSMILINETVLPDVGADWRQTQRDIHMMAALATLERSESQFRALLAKAGLKLRDIYCYNQENGNSVVVAIPA